MGENCPDVDEGAHGNRFVGEEMFMEESIHRKVYVDIHSWA